MWKVSGEDSVAAVPVIRANADPSDKIHEIILSPGCARPCAAELEATYALIRKVGEEAVSLRCRHRRVRAVKKEEQTREAMAIAREDEFMLKQPGAV